MGKLNHKGQLIWFRQLGGLGHDQIHSLFVDEKSTVSIAGSFTDTLYAMRGDGSWDFLVSAGAKDGFVISYSDTGSLKLHTRFGGASSDEATSLVGQGEMFWLGGYFHGNANFGSQEVQSRGEEDLFLASVDSKGQWQQVFSAGSVSNDRILSMAFSPKAKMFWILGQAGSGAILGEDTLKSAGKTDYFLIPCNTDGHCSSLKQFGFGTASPNGEEIITLAADSKGSAYLGGRFRYRLALLKPPKPSKGGWDFFIGKVTPWPWPKIKNELQKK